MDILLTGEHFGKILQDGQLEHIKLDSGFFICFRKTLKIFNHSGSATFWQQK
jgi:hypothetical protein